MPVVVAPARGADMVTMFRFGSSLQTSGVLWFGAFEVLQIQFNIEGYSGGAIASLKFGTSATAAGATSDATAANYATEYLTWSTGAPTVSNVLGTFGGFKLGANGVTSQRSGFVTVKNNSSVSHQITCASITESNSTTSADTQSSGGGKYRTGTATQITSVELFTDTSGITMPAGTSITVFGFNPA